MQLLKQMINNPTLNKNPIKIDDLKSFLTEITSRYFEVTNDYHKQYSEIQTKRRTAKLVEA